jgi:predicted RNA-binding protein with PIN domain
MKHLLIDGYNVIFRWPELKKHIPANLPMAIDLLVHELSAFCDRESIQGYLFLDGKNAVRDVAAPRVESLLSTVFTQAGETADSAIERWVYAHRSIADQVQVITADNLLSETVSAAGAWVFSPEHLLEWVDQSAVRQARQFVRKQSLAKPFGGSLDQIPNIFPRKK